MTGLTSWKKPTASSGGSCNCVEIRLSPMEVQIRDSKNIAPVLRFPVINWLKFLNETDELQEI